MGYAYCVQRQPRPIREAVSSTLTTLGFVLMLPGLLVLLLASTIEGEADEDCED